MHAFGYLDRLPAGRAEHGNPLTNAIVAICRYDPGVMAPINSTDAEVGQLLKILETNLKGLDGWDVDSRRAIETAVKETIQPANHAGVVTTSEADVLRLATQIKELLDFMGATETDYAKLVRDLREGGPILKTLRLQFAYTDEQVAEILSRQAPRQPKSEPELADRVQRLGYTLQRMSGYLAKRWNAGDWVIFDGDTANFVATCGPKLSDVEAWLTAGPPAKHQD